VGNKVASGVLVSHWWARK